MRILDCPRPVLFWLRFLVVICVVPTSATTALAIKNFYEREHNTLAKSTVRTASDLMQAVELDLASATAALQVLAMSRDLHSGNLAAFRDCAREALLSQTGNVIVLTEATGQQLMSTLKPYGEPLPRTGVPELLTAVLNTAKPSISDFFIGATSRQPQVAVSVPVIRDGKVTRSLTMGILPDRLQAILRDQHLPPDWVVSVFDRHGTIIARTHAPDQFVGHQGSPDLLRRMQIASEGILEGETLEHVPVLGTFSRSNLSGWAVAIGIPTAGLFADLRRSLWLNVAAAGAFLGFALLLAWVVSLRIAGSIRVLSEPALALASAVPNCRATGLYIGSG